MQSAVFHESKITKQKGAFFKRILEDKGQYTLTTTYTIKKAKR